METSISTVESQQAAGSDVEERSRPLLSMNTYNNSNILHNPNLNNRSSSRDVPSTMTFLGSRLFQSSSTSYKSDRSRSMEGKVEEEKDHEEPLAHAHYFRRT
jgi:hypothetical protein